MLPPVSFRHDINFLRAVAVCSVLLFHFGISIFSGGFAGVDVFFVISGYLMGAIICKGLDSRRFSLADFYLARVKRIIPALMVLCLFCLACGWFLLAPDDFHTQALHARDSLLFISNETYRDEAGYFDARSHEKWLLHTWSLSVEWQFYLLLPLILWIFKWLFNTPKLLFNTLAAVTLIALAICVDKTARSPENAFFLLKYRCWEMLVGVLVYLLPAAYPRCVGFFRNKSLARLITLICIVTIGFSFIFFDEHTLWPSWYAVVPVFATAVLILLNQQYPLYRYAAVSWFGSRSYSLYLWHWPLVVLVTYFSLSNIWYWVAGAILLSLLLAEISFRWVEEPVRKTIVNRWILLAGVVGVGLLIILLSQWIMHNKGFSERVSVEVRQVLTAKNDRNTMDRNCIGNFTDEVPNCQLGSSQTNVIVIGDSHAHSIVTAVLDALPAGSGVSYWGFLACPIISKIASDAKCAEFNASLEQRLKQMPPNTDVLIASRFSYYPFGEGLNGYDRENSQPQVHFGSKQKRVTDAYLAEYRRNTTEQLCRLAKHSRVAVLLPMPEMRELVPQTMARRLMRGETQRVSISRDDYQLRNGFILSVLEDVARACGVKLLDPREQLCDTGHCYGDYNGMPIYYDDDHLTENGNKLLLPLFDYLISD